MKYSKKWCGFLILACVLTCPLVSRAEDKVTGIELNDVHALNIGIVNKIRGSVIHGFELGAVNVVDEDFSGFQLGIFYNETRHDVRGLQLGIVNHAGSLDGIQIGILNFNDDTRYLGFFPFINAAF